MANYFIINFGEWIIQILPIKLRKTRMTAWLLAQIKPIETLYAQFLRFRNESIYKIDHTPQVFSMVNVLNDNFDIALRRIRIIDGEYKSPTYFYEPQEDNSVHFYEPTESSPIHFYEPQELLLLGVDFVVILPQNLGITFSEMTRLRALIDFYRLPDKTYEIIIQ